MSRRALPALTVAALALVFATGVGAAFGSAPIPLTNVLRVAVGAESDVVPVWQAQALVVSRFPRVLVLALVGGALAAAGAALQSTFRNAMADPSILGVSGGGALGAVLAVRGGLAAEHAIALPLCAFAGALTAALLVHLLAHLFARPSTTSLLLTGIAVSSLTSALVSLVLTRTEEYQLKNILFWLVGGAEGAGWRHLEMATLPILVGLALLVASQRTIDALAAGDEQAASIGVPVTRARLFVLALCALVSGAAVAVAGPIAFVGLMVPNGARLLVGSRAALLVPVSIFGGGAFLVLCDLAARAIFTERVVPVGLVTSLLGVPYFLWLLVRSRRSAV